MPLHFFWSVHPLKANLPQVLFQFLNSRLVRLQILLELWRNLDEITVLVEVDFVRGRHTLRQLVVATVLVSGSKDIIGDPPADFVFPERGVVAILDFVESLHYVLFFFF